MKKVLIIGSGGREHALAWKILQSPRLGHLFLTAQNASTALLKQQYPDKAIALTTVSEQDFSDLVEFARAQHIDLVIIGSEVPLALGLSNACHAAGINVFGPSKEAAQIEADKSFAKDFMVRHAIPTARYAVFTELTAALEHVRHVDYPIVIKASGLASGKGVFLPTTSAESEQILQQLMADKSLGSAGDHVIIEERLSGEEISVLAFSDGTSIVPMPPARDYKRLQDADIGPNTGGMGAYAPAHNLCSEEILTRITQDILLPAVAGLRQEGRPFVGVLYAGIMLTAKGPSVLEFNARFGDPETQVLLPLLDTDLLDIMEACVDGQLDRCNVQWKNANAVCVILASQGYPQQSKIGLTIHGLLPNDTHSAIFHAGTAWCDGNIQTAGGRVLGITTWDHSLTNAINAAYEKVKNIHFDGMHYRSDIAQHNAGVSR